MAMKSQQDEMKQFQLSDEEHDKHLSILVDCVDQAKSVLPHNDHQVTLSKMVSRREGGSGDVQRRAVQQPRGIQRALKGWSQAESVPLLPTVTNDATSYIVLDGIHRVDALQNIAGECNPPEAVEKVAVSGCILTRVII